MSRDGDDTRGKQFSEAFEQNKWVAGQSGNPRGRPKGARNRLADQFLADLEKEWRENGADTLTKAREEDPVQFAKMVASLLPKESLVRHTFEDDMTDDELAETIDALDRLRDQLGAGREGPRPTHGGQGTA